MNRELLARTREWTTERTGKFESTGWAEVDRAVAAKVNEIFSNAVIAHPNQEQARYASFLARAPQDRVFVGNFDSIVEFLGAVRRAAAGRRSIPKNLEINRDALPLINISRTFDVSYDSNDYQRDRRELGELLGEDGKTPIAEVEATQATLTYSVTLIAAEKGTLSLMCNTLASAMRFMPSTSFKAASKLVNARVELDCCFQDAKGIGYGDISAPMQENRLFAAQASVTVLADVFTAFEVEAKQIRVHAYSGVME